MRLILLLTIVLLSGCVSTPVKVEQDPSLNLNNAAKLVIYRPSSDIFGVAIDLRTFINGQFVGTLNSGGASIERLVNPGPITVAVKPYFLGIQDGQVATSALNGKAGSTIYLRLTRDMGIPVVNGNATYFIGSESRLNQVSDKNWTNRE